MKKKLINKILIIVILILALGVRIYKLESVPPSLTWDEVAVGYNAFTVANYGKDEYGKLMPLIFQSFGEGKNPIHIYITALFVKFMDLNEFTTRLPAAIFGTGNIILLYILVSLLLKNQFVSILSAFFLAISPYNIHFSRFNHEANFALFFLLLGLILFFLSIREGKPFLVLSVTAFLISFISYNASKIFIPSVSLALIFIYKDQLLKSRKQLILCLALVVIFSFFILKNPELLGEVRASQTIQGKVDWEKTSLFKLTKNELLGRVNLALLQYPLHFSLDFLFIKGDKNPRLSSQKGQFYPVDVIFLVAGFAYLVRKRSKDNSFVLIWALLAPLPSSLFAEAPHGGRSMFLMGSFHIILALGFYFIFCLIKSYLLKVAIATISILILVISLGNFLIYYHGEYAKRYAIDWQYGMKEIVYFVKANPTYNPVFVTDERGQPYIFFLFYLKTPLHEYLSKVLYNNLPSNSYNNVVNFDKFYFGGKWEPLESVPKVGYLYVVTPSEYDGMRNRDSFDVKKIVHYPNGTNAFYLVSTK